MGKKPFEEHALPVPLTVTDTARPRGPLTLGDTAIVGALIIVGIAIPVTLATHLHSFDIARNDDWAYLRVLSGLVHAGHYRMVGWGAMTLVGQVLWAALFEALLGAHAWVPGTSVAVLSAVGLVSAYLISRSLVGRAGGAACLLLVLALPGFLTGTTDFMTDVPAFSAEMATMALGLAALGRSGTRRWACLAAALAVGIFGFSIREFDLAAPAAVLVTLAAQDPRHLGRYSLAGAGVLAGCAAIYLWSTQLAGAQHKGLGLPTTSSWRALAAAYFTVAFFLSPLLPRAIRRCWSRASWISPAIGALALAVGAVLMDSHQPLLIGNNLTQQGASAGEVLFGARPDLFPGRIWLILEIVALASGTVLAFVVASPGLRPLASRVRGRCADGEALAWWFTALSGAGLIAYGLFVRAALWDRYIWPVAFGAALLLLRPRPANIGAHMAGRLPSWQWRCPAAALALILATVTAALTINADAYDWARWSAGQDAEKLGFAPSTIDAGFEWVGSHATTTAQPGRKLAGAPPYDTWYDQMFSGFKDCVLVSGSKLDEPPLVLRRLVTYNELGFAFPEHLYVYSLRTLGCDGAKGR